MICDKLERIQLILSQENIFKSLRYIVVFQDIPVSYKQKGKLIDHSLTVYHRPLPQPASALDITILTIAEVEQIGERNPVGCHVRREPLLWQSFIPSNKLPLVSHPRNPSPNRWL